MKKIDAHRRRLITHIKLYIKEWLDPGLETDCTDFSVNKELKFKGILCLFTSLNSVIDFLSKWQ
jgi:hypothetical protein